MKKGLCMYHISTSKEGSEIGTISEYSWGCRYQPESIFTLWYEVDKGFHLTMICFEEQPLAVYKRHNDPVYKDSCLEFFVDFYPDDQTGYLNFEINANGATLLYFGKNRENRVSVVDWLIEKPAAIIYPSYWQVELFIPLDFIKRVYKKSNFTGSLIKANVYKCGDDTEIPHYGAWCKIETEQPDFHQPDYFGWMKITSSK